MARKSEFLKTLKRCFRRLGLTVQKIIVSSLLFFVYIIFMGITALIAVKFARRTNKSAKTFWHEAEDYTCDPVNITRQS